MNVQELPISKRIKKKVQPKWYIFALVMALVFEFLRPQDSFLSVLSPLKLPALTMLSLIFIFLVNNKSYIKQEKGYQLMIAFWLVVTVSVLYAVNTAAVFGGFMTMLLFLVGFIFPMAVILDSFERIFLYWKAFIIVHFFVAIVVIMHGGTGPGGIVSDENDVALALVMAVPFTLYYASTSGVSRLGKIVAISAALVMMGGVGISASRGGVVALAATIGMMVLMSRRPVKNGSLLLLLLLIAGGAFIASLPPEYVNDMANITNPEDDTRDERIYSWSIGLVMFLDNPFLGLGAGNYPWTNHFYYQDSPLWEPGRKFLGGRAAHSVYFTVLPELGLAGTLIFLALIKISFNRCRIIKRRLSRYRGNKVVGDAILLSNAMMASMTGFLIGGAFISVLYYPFFWYLVAFILVFFSTANKVIRKMSDEEPLNNSEVKQ